MRKTKIVCTLGPSTDDLNIIKSIIQKGMNVSRLNFSHGSHYEHESRINMVKKAVSELKTHIAIMLDTKGPEIRVGTFENNKVILKEGNEFILTPEEYEGDEGKVSITYEKLANDVSIGSRILIDDGLIQLKVKDIRGKDVICEIINGGELSDRKGINLPGISINLPALTDKDIEDILFGIKMDIDFIAASFIRKRSDVLEIRKVLEDNKAAHIDIISKIENQEGVNNIDEIIKVSDGIMVARGDMGVEIPPEEVPVIQKMIIEKCNRLGKPVITATQMLDSMIRNPVPTRAEASDVANAIIDGTDAIMLSGETAAGKYPLESVEMMAKIAKKTEASLGIKSLKQDNKVLPNKTVTDAISYGTVTAAKDLIASAIITSTKSGHTARMVSKYRPESKIIAVTPSLRILRKLCLTWGVKPAYVKDSETTDEMIENAVEVSLDAGLISKGDLVVITAGVPVGVTGTTNLLKVHVVGDIIAKGTGIGSKSITGRVLIAKTSKEAISIEDGDILVTIGIDKEYIPYLEKASGIISEESGLTSNTAIIGLQLGIPVIVGVEGATEKITNRSLITIDTEKGLVYKGKTRAL